MNQLLLDQILDSPRLPSLPSVAVRIIELVQRDDATLRDISDVIHNDPALTSKVLRTVNSSFYGLNTPCSTITQALIILGLNAVKTIALGFTLVNRLKQVEADDFDFVAFWKRSLYAATAARMLAEHIEMMQYEEAFLGGLMQDLGMLVLHQIDPDRYGQLMTQVKSHRMLRAAESQAFDLDHTIVGAALASRWRLHPMLIAPIRFHESPDSAPQEIRPLVQCVVVGNDVADIFTSEESGKWLSLYRRHCYKWFNLPQPVADGLLERTNDAVHQMRNLFDLPTGELADAESVLQAANEQLTKLSLVQHREVRDLAERNRRLVAQSLTDPLTRIANRRRFDEMLSLSFIAASPQRPLSLLMLDVDHFKHINDTHGHVIGDRVLQMLAERLTRSIPPPAMVARYGGEEFAVLLANTFSGEADHLAELVRSMIQHLAIADFDATPFNITVSIGVATHDGRMFDCPDELVAASDRGLYNAKHDGRNCVRRYVPHSAAA